MIRFLTLLTVLISCGGNSSSPEAVDAPLVDASVADETEFQITIMNGSDAMQDVAILISDSVGEPVATIRTDDSGKANYKVPNSASVTIIAGLDILTIVDVNNNDAIIHDLETGSDQTVGEAVIQLPTPPAGTNIIRAINGCKEWAINELDQPITLEVSERCLKDNKMAVLGVAVGDNATILAFSDLKGIDTSSGGTINVAMPAWRTDFTAFSMGVMGGNLGDTVNVQAEHVVNGAGYRAPFKSGNSQRRTLLLLPGFTEYVRYSLQVPQGPTGNNGSQPSKMFYGAQIAMPTSEHDIDLTTELLPAVVSSNAVMINSDQFELNWTSDGALSSVDGIIARTRYFAGGEVRWGFLLPPGSTKTTSPRLPPEFDALNPSSPDVPFVVAAESSLIESWSEFKEKGTKLIFGPRFLSDEAQTMRGSIYFPSPF